MRFPNSRETHYGKMNDNAHEMKIHTFPDAVLRNRARPIEDIDDEVRTLAGRMLCTMYAAPGIGLAANQVGEARRLIVFEKAPTEGRGSACVLINPEIVDREGKIVYEEACLSVVDFAAEVERSARVLVKGLDRDGNPLTIEAEGLLAVCLQHEIDHLDGTLFIDHISSLKRAMYKKRLMKRAKDE